MALIAGSTLPAFATMEQEGVVVVDAGTAQPDLTVGLLNLMPDAALRATDRQFVRLVSAAVGDLDIRVLPFTVAASGRGEQARKHIADHYLSFDRIRVSGLDALIITGANPARDRLEEEVFWSELGEVLDWAVEETDSILCSCLATHAVLQKYRDTVRTRLPEKMWGVYRHEIVADHPLLQGLDGDVEAPHSHWYDVTREEFESVGLTVLVESGEAGVHMAVDEEDFYVFFQGHPEYDLVSLLKEYRRELGRYWRREREEYPPLPANYFDEVAAARLEAYQPVLEAATRVGADPPRLDESELLPTDRHVWNEQGQVIYRNWLRSLAG